MPLIRREPVIEPALTAALQDAGARGLTMGELVAVAQSTPFKSYDGTYSALRRMFDAGKIARVFEYQPVGRNRFGKREYRYFLLMYANAGMPGIEMPTVQQQVSGLSGWTPWTPNW